MTPEQKAAIAAAAEAAKNAKAEGDQANADEVVPEPIEGQETNEADETDHSQLDYEAIAKAEKDRADAAEKAAADLAFKMRRGKREEVAEDIDDEGEDEDKPLTRRELQSILAGERQTIQKETSYNAALTIARSNTASEAEAQAAVTFWKTRVTPSGNLEDDVLFAIGGLNRKRTAAKIVEVGRALKSKETALHSSANTYRETGAAGEPKISANDAQALKQAGMVWDGKQRVYKKSLGNGSKHLFFDPKTKKRWTA